MIQMVLVRLDLNRKELGMTPGDANKFFRRLYGYHSCSHYGRYHHWVDGLLDKINGRRIANGAIMIPEINFSQLEEYLESNGVIVQVVSDRIFMDEGEFAKINSMGKEKVTQK